MRLNERVRTIDVGDGRGPEAVGKREDLNWKGVDISIPGLCLTDLEDIGEWGITHVKTGRRILPVHFKTIASLERVLPILQGVDWTREKDDLIQDPDVEKIYHLASRVAQVADFRRKGARKQYIKAFDSELRALAYLGRKQKWLI